MLASALRAASLLLPVLVVSTAVRTTAEDPVAHATGPRVEVPAYEGAPRSTMRATYEGRFELEAHLAKPHDTRAFGTRLTLVVEGADRARLDWETWPVGREKELDVETTLLAGQRAWHKPDASSPFVEETGRTAAHLRQRVEAAIPWRTLARLRSSAEPVARASDGSSSWTEREFGARRIAWNADMHRIASVTRDYAHPRLGDVRDEAVYRTWETRDGVVVPASFTLKELEGENPLRANPGSFDLHLVSFDNEFEAGNVLDAPPDVPGGPVAPGARIADAAPAPSATVGAPAEPAPIIVEELEPGLVSFLAQAEQGRTYTVEFEDHLIAIDAPLSSALAERILAAIRARFPSKPVRYVLFGHFHPYYTGGLRAFLAAGAKVVAPEGCARFAAEIAHRPFTLEPDAWARAAREADIETFHGSRVFDDASRKLEAIDIGKASGHTDQYVVFHLARTKTLVQDDVGWFAGKDGTLRFGAGARGIHAALTARGLDVETLWQSWPVDHPRPSISFAEFEQGVKSPR